MSVNKQFPMQFLYCPPLSTRKRNNFSGFTAPV